MTEEMKVRSYELPRNRDEENSIENGAIEGRYRQFKSVVRKYVHMGCTQRTR